MPHNSHASHGLTPDLVARFTAAQERWKKTSGESSTSAVTTPSGGTPAAGAGSPSSLTSLAGEVNDLFERLARLATTEPPAGRPPLETYTTTPSEHGDLCRATHAFRDWMRSNYRGYGVGNHSAVTPPGRVAQTLGREPTERSPIDRFKTQAPGQGGVGCLGRTPPRGTGYPDRPHLPRRCTPLNNARAFFFSLREKLREGLLVCAEHTPR